MKQKLYQALASAVDAYHRCVEKGNDFAEHWEARLDYVVANILPSGSGFDSGTRLYTDASGSDKLVFLTSFHHMNESGYCGWTDHRVTIKPNLALDFTITVAGRDRNGIKDYIADVFGQIMRRQGDWTLGDTWTEE